MSLLQRLAGVPWVYDLVQRAAGMRDRRRRLRAEVERLPQRPGIAVDLGGGTGNYAGVWPAETTYVCLDDDPTRLSAFLRKRPGGLAVVGDAARLPFADGCVDAVACIALSHHLDDNSLASVLAESARVLAQPGVLLFLDALLVPESRLVCWFWRHDRGEHPRTAEGLVARVSDRFEIVADRRYSYLHRYVLLVCRPKAAVTSQ